MNQYSSKIAKEILEKFNQKGWNLYKSGNVEEVGAENTIRKNLAKSLELGSYVLLPSAKNPKKPKQVFEALEKLSQKLDKKMPTISVNDETYPLTGITLKEDGVKIHTPEGTHVTYPAFMEALESVIQTC